MPDMKGMLLDRTHGRPLTPATSTLNCATTLMTSRMAGLQSSKINHELCHYTDDVARMLGFNSSNINHELCHYTVDVTHGRASTQQDQL
jgi:predicted SprT family Zn-dependent metalloprotease